MSYLAPVQEEPIDEEEVDIRRSSRSKRSSSWSKWLKNHILHHPLVSPPKKSNLKILLSVLACPLSPISTPPVVPLQVSSKAQYIIQQFRATTRMDAAAKSLYASGKVTLAMATSTEEELATSLTWPSRRGSFVVWQMDPGMWLMELVVERCKIVAGSDGRVAWRHTPWLGTHAAPGGVRPLRRAMQGLDPWIIMSIFSSAQYMGEKQIENESCFSLMLEADQPALSARSDGTAEIIKHVMVGYFSQRSGLLVHLDDFQLTRIQTPGSQPIFWETSMASHVRDYRPVDGTTTSVLVAHSGRSVVNLVRFGQGMNDQHETTRMEEEWSIDDVAFNVAGLSSDCFIPPEEVRRNSSEEKAALARV